MSCCRNVLKEMPMLRRVILLTSLKASQEFYAQQLGMWDTREEEGLVTMTRKAYEES